MSQSPSPNADPADKILLWGVNASPYVRKVKILLEEKGLAYEQQQLLPKVFLKRLAKPIPEEYDRISPLGKIPFVRIGAEEITDSAVIAAYVEKRWPAPALFPKALQAYGQALRFQHYGDYVLSAIATSQLFFENFAKKSVFNEAPDPSIVDKALNDKLPPLLNHLNESLGQQPWFAGNDYSIADIAIGVHLRALDLAVVNVDATRWPQLADFKERFFCT